MTFIQCDRCNARNPELPSGGWRAIRMHYIGEAFGITVHLCPGCIAALKLPNYLYKTTPEKLVELLEEIARKVVQDEVQQ